MFYRLFFNTLVSIGCIFSLTNCSYPYGVKTNIPQGPSSGPCSWETDGSSNEACHREKMQKILSDPSMRNLSRHPRATPEFSRAFNRSTRMEQERLESENKD